MLTINHAVKKLFFEFTGLPGIRNFGNPFRGKASILCYHRVLPDKAFALEFGPNQSLIVPVSGFEKQMIILQKYYDVVSMDEMIHHIQSTNTDYKVAITFDDGYKDNLLHALPVLEKYNMPATIYITTRFPEGNTWMWWYEVWDKLNCTNKLKVKYSNKLIEYDLHLKKNKLVCFQNIRKLILSLNNESQNILLENITSSSVRNDYQDLCLTWEEIKLLDQHPLITIGSHSHTHPNLKILTDDEIKSEMRFSKLLLEDILQHKIDHFAYPYGTLNEADDRVYDLAFNSEYLSAVTTRKDRLYKQSNFELPRVGVPSYLGSNGLHSKLSGWPPMINKLLS